MAFFTGTSAGLLMTNSQYVQCSIQRKELQMQAFPETRLAEAAASPEAAGLLSHTYADADFLLPSSGSVIVFSDRTWWLL
jgi:hypothetical protein